MKISLYNKKNNEKKGATLLELLLYIGIVTIILSISGALSMNIIFSKAKAAAFEEVAANARVAFHLIEVEINNANSIDIIQGSASSSISLSVSSQMKNPIIFGIENGILWQKIGVNEKKYLTTDNVNIINIEFRNMSFVETSFLVNVNMTIESDIIYPRGNQKISKVFNTTIYKR